MPLTSVGRIIFVDEEVEPYRLLDYNGACIMEIVDGQYRVEKLSEEADVKEQGDK